MRSNSTQESGAQWNVQATQKSKPVSRPDYSTANHALRREWAFWRFTAKHFGFGRHQLQPIRASGEVLGRYLGEYLSKDWEHRLPEDKGARCIRIFGQWGKGGRAAGELVHLV